MTMDWQWNGKRKNYNTTRSIKKDKKDKRSTQKKYKNDIKLKWKNSYILIKQKNATKLRI